MYQIISFLHSSLFHKNFYLSNFPPAYSDLIPSHVLFAVFKLVLLFWGTWNFLPHGFLSWNTPLSGMHSLLVLHGYLSLRSFISCVWMLPPERCLFWPLIFFLNDSYLLHCSWFFFNFIFHGKNDRYATNGIILCLIVIAPTKCKLQGRKALISSLLYFYSLGHWFSYCDPRTAVSVSSGNLLEMNILGSFPRSIESSTLGWVGVGAAVCVLQVLQLTLMHFKIRESLISNSASHKISSKKYLNECTNI